MYLHFTAPSAPLQYIEILGIHTFWPLSALTQLHFFFQFLLIENIFFSQLTLVGSYHITNFVCTYYK